MRPIPIPLRNELNDDPYYEKCARENTECDGRITWEHAFEYGGKQINRRWAIIPLCEEHHFGKAFNKRENQRIAIRRATNADFLEFPKRDWKQLKEYLMKISAHTIIKNPDTQGYPYICSISSVAQMVDEIIIVDGGSTDKSIERIVELSKLYPNVEFIFKELPFPEEFNWTQIPISMNAGLSLATGDWAMKFDTDYIFHEDDVDKFRDRLQKHLHTGNLVLNLDKKQVFKDLYYSKAKCPFVIRKGEGIPEILYGKATNDRANDLMFPVYVDEFDGDGIAHGDSIFALEENIANLGIDFYNYDFTFMTKEQILYLRFRFERAWQLYFNGQEAAKNLTKERVWQMFEKMMSSRLRRDLQKLPIEEQPQVIQDRIRNLKPEQFGYNNFGLEESGI